MTETALDTQAVYTADLLASLQESILRLRHAAEGLRAQLETDGVEEITGASGQISKLEGLIRDCQKVEKTLAEQSSQFNRLSRSEAALDLGAARSEILRRLDGLRAVLAGGDVPG
ncbi:hypothetical protein ACUXV3_05805 [Roseobacteraceae bacterium NS-SX3]